MKTYARRKLSNLQNQGEKNTMELNLKKLLPLTGMICGCLMSFVNAHDTNSKHARSMNDNLPMNDNPPMNEITPNAGPRVSNGADVFMTADFIWWKVRQDGMGYVMSNFKDNQIASGSPSSAVSVERGSVRHISEELKPGFKVGIGLNLGHDGWDLMTEYTWLHTDNSDCITHNNASASQLFPMWDITHNRVLTDPSLDAGSGITSAFADWDLHFKVIDLELARNYYTSQYLTLRPYVGLKGAQIDQEYSVRYLRVQNDSLTASATNFRMTNDQCYKGLGIRTGLDTSWYFVKNFCMYGEFSVAAMWSYFTIDRKDSVENAGILPAAPSVNVIHVRNNFHTIKPVVELGLGFRYDWWYSDDDCHFGLQAGWEEQIWVNHNNLLHLFDETNHGDLITQGLTIKARFDF